MFLKLWDMDSLETYESTICLYLNKAYNTIGWLKVSQGGISGMIIDVRLVLATALKCLARGIILCHNHPSGNVNPSVKDKLTTTKLKQACDLLGMTLLNHIIICTDGYYSFAYEGLF